MPQAAERLRAEQGKGPLVVLCHGFPESWYSWRYQLTALSAAGFHVVAPDMRGYGRSDRPEAIDQYTLLPLIGDMVGLLDALGVDHAVIAGHDWGAPLAWHSALLRPDRFRAVIGLSVPFRPRAPVAPTSVMPRRDNALFYQLYFQTPSVAEAEFERDVRQAVVKLLFAASGDAPRGATDGDVGMVPLNGGFLTGMPNPVVLPPWLSEADVDFYVGEFCAHGLSWWPQLVPKHRPKLGAACAVRRRAGDRPGTLYRRRPRSGRRVSGHGSGYRNLANHVPQLRGTIMLSGCGHWTQQERASEVNNALIDFLRQL